MKWFLASKGIYIAFMQKVKVSLNLETMWDSVQLTSESTVSSFHGDNITILNSPDRKQKHTLCFNTIIILQRYIQGLEKERLSFCAIVMCEVYRVLQDVSLLPQTALAALTAFAGGETAIATLSTVINLIYQ